MKAGLGVSAMGFIVLGNLDNPRTTTPARYQDFWGWLKLLLSLMGLFGFCLWLAPPAYAQDALCAEVKIVIEQKLSLERQAFDAHMTITNGLGNAALEDIRVVLNFADQDGNPVVATTDPNATGAAFFMRLESLTGIGAVDGTGQIAPKSAGDIHWLFVGASRRRTGRELSNFGFSARAPSNPHWSVTPSGRLRRPVLVSPPPTTTRGT